MELRKILPDLVKEVVKQTLESIMIMIAEREVFLKENGGTKNGFYVRSLDTVVGKLKNLKIPRVKGFLEAREEIQEMFLRRYS